MHLLLFFIVVISITTLFFLRHSVYYSTAAETRQMQVEHIQIIQIHPRTVCKNAHPHLNDSAVQYNQQ